MAAPAAPTFTSFCTTHPRRLEPHDSMWDKEGALSFRLCQSQSFSGLGTNQTDASPQQHPVCKEQSLNEGGEHLVWQGGKVRVQAKQELGRGTLRTGATVNRQQAYHGGLQAGSRSTPPKFRNSPGSRRLLLRGNALGWTPRPQEPR